MEIFEMKAAELALCIRQKEISAAEAVEAALARIAKTNPAIKAFLYVAEENARKKALEIDRKIHKGEALGPLAGVPVALKDNICTKGIPTTCASHMLEGYVPVYSATVCEKLEAAGAILVGKTNLDEFAMGSSSEDSYFGPTRNPWDPSRVAGGSSGGSAAAVAACQVPLALGSDTGGSVRLPAAWCGIVGLRPTYGAVSRYGLIPFASSLDQVGPMGRTVQDVALAYAAIHGPDAARDATSREFPFEHRQCDDLQGLIIGVPREYFAMELQSEVRSALEEALRQLEGLGARVREVSLPSAQHTLSAYYTLSSAEAASNLARYDGVKYGYSAPQQETLEDLYVHTRSQGFGDEAKRRILLGAFVLCSEQNDAYYRRAQGVRQRITRELVTAFEGCDVIVTPTSPTTAFPLGQHRAAPTGMYAADACAVPASLAGLPALSLPCGRDSNGLPIGLQLVGPEGSEGALLSAAGCYETAVGGFPVKGVGK